MTMGSVTVSGKPDERHVPDSQRVLRELERHGYVIEPHSAGSPGGAICRHPAAPSLLVFDDGRIELIGGRPAMSSQVPLNPIRWRRGLLFLALLCVATFLGLLMVGAIVG